VHEYGGMKDVSEYLDRETFQIKDEMIVFSFVQLHCMKFCVETLPDNLLSVHSRTGHTQVKPLC
jgi:hypothetical protein